VTSRNTQDHCLSVLLPWSTSFEDPIILPDGQEAAHAEGRGHRLHYETAEEGDRAYPEMVYSRWVRFLAELGAINGGGICLQAVFFILFQVTTMIDETVARLRAHNGNIIRYRRLLETELSDLERGFIEMRLNEERSAVKSLANQSPADWD
jgi:hypothetical protein